jgi:hypothetical protein
VASGERIVAMGLLTRRDIDVLGIGSQSMFPLQDNVIPDAIDFPRAHASDFLPVHWGEVPTSRHRCATEADFVTGACRVLIPSKVLSPPPKGRSG